jgi:tetratricopeptide (TPR) repeat protein/predicted Ser/Thr protein kinase
MTEERRARLWALFDQAADLTPHEQRALLDAACPDDPNLRAELEKLLADDARVRAGGTNFLMSPVLRSLPATLSSPEPASAPAAPPRIGRYHIIRILGEGGMGTVYEAEQDSPRRAVALKVIRPGLVVPAALKRFAREAQILGLLHHPGVAAIYEAGVAEDGRPFFAMELVRGVPLDEYARRHGLDSAARLELLARVCDAVQHAHEHGVVHRDLKPSNVLVDDAGQPRVLDFGVARGLDDALRDTTAQTRPGQIVGTPSYMSPEQVAADPNLDRRSDVYTLGVILFELLAGRPPYPLESLPLAEAVRVIREREPARLGALDRGLRGDAETIAGKALEKDPSRRYASAEELAADIRRHLAQEPILARPPSALYQLSKFARRHKPLALTTAALLSLLLLAGAVTAWQQVRLARAERDEAVRQGRRGQEAQEALARAVALRDQARATDDAGKWAEAREVARQAAALAEGGPPAPGLAERIADLRRELDEEEADRRLVGRLEEIRLGVAEVNEEGQFAGKRAWAQYRQAFADYGLRVGSDATEAAARIRGRPPTVRGPAVAALDVWLSRARREDPAEVGWLEEVLAAVDPDDWRQRVRAARVAGDQQALEKLAREVKVATQPPQALLLLSADLNDFGSAVRLVRRAQNAYPGDFWISHKLGMGLMTSDPPQLDEAIRFLTAAVALRPESPGARLNLGTALWKKGRLDEAGDAFRKAVELKPDYVQAHHNLGVVLQNQGDLPGAERSFRRATEVDPKYAPPRLNLGNLLQQQGDLPGAEACFRRMTEFDPNNARAHGSLGDVLLRQGDLPGAAACYRRALQLAPGFAEAHCNLGHALLFQGDLHAALAEYRTGHDLGSRRKGWGYDSAGWVQGCEHLIELDGRLPAVLRGERPPAGAAGFLELAALCRYKGLHASSVRFYTEALDADATLAEVQRFRAACSAAQAGCGEGEDAAAAPDKARASLRKQAREWLRADLAGWARRLAGGTPRDRAEVRTQLGIWLVHPALAGVRDAGRLAALPAEERAVWQQYWAEVSALAAKARDGN